MNINLEYYKIFYYVAKYGNITKAARALRGSQPNITRAINGLEHELGCTLFVRTNRGVRLTPEGERLYSHVSSAMLQLQAAEDEMSVSTGLEHGSIAIGASETALNIYLLPHLRKYHMTYPKIRLKIYNHSTPQAVRAVQSGEIDFAVMTTPTNAEAPLSEIPLMPFREILVGGGTFTALSTQTISLSELQSYPFISLGSESMTYQFYRRIFMEHGIDYAPDTEAATTDQVLSLVENELGLAFLPEPMAQKAISAKLITQIKLVEDIPSRNVCMVYDKKRPLSVAAARLKNYLLESRPYS